MENLHGQEPRWYQELLEKSPILQEFLEVDIRSSGWGKEIEPYVNRLLKETPETLNSAETLLKVISDLNNFGKNVLNEDGKESNNRIKIIILFIGYELETNADSLQMSKAIVDKLANHGLIEPNAELCQTYEFVCDILFRGVQMREEILKETSPEIPQAFQNFINTLDMSGF